MARLPPPSTFPETNSGEEQNDDGKAVQSYHGLISTWEVRDASTDIWTLPLRRHKDSWFAFDWIILNVVAANSHFVAHPTDVLAASFPKSGTTWMKALLFAIVHRLDDNAAAVLRTTNPHDCVPLLEGEYYSGKILDLDFMPSSRLFQTHIPLCSLPPSVEASGCRIVYVWRDPKDVVVSWWFFNNRMRKNAGLQAVAIEAFVESFIQGSCPFGPYWDHVLGYWNYGLKNPGNMLILRYEEMLDDPVGNVRKIAEFLGKKFSTVEEQEGVPEGIVQLCSLNSLKKMQINMEGNITSFGNTYIQNADFFRNGKAGDWVAHLTPEMARRIDEITEQKFGSLGFPNK